MARYPSAIWRPIDAAFLPNRRMAVYNRMNLHVAVSEAASLHGFFNAKGRASSHFYVRKDGTVEQYVDTAWQAECDLDGNDATISVETQGGLRNAQGEPWTAAQVDALARLYAWAVTTHGIALRLAQDSRPGASSRGLSWHRLGIDPWRKPDGMRYSNAPGKVCPGDAKIRQIPEVLARAVQILDPTSAPPTDTNEDEMTPEQARRLDAIYDAIFNGGPSMPYGAPITALIDDIPRRVAVLVGEGQDVDPALIAAAIPENIAQQVVEALGHKLSPQITEGA